MEELLSRFKPLLDRYSLQFGDIHDRADLRQELVITFIEAVRRFDLQQEKKRLLEYLAENSESKTMLRRTVRRV